MAHAGGWHSFDRRSPVAARRQYLLLTWTSFLIGFSALLPMVNPLGSAFELLSLVGNAPIPVYRRLALRIAIDNILFLLVIEVLGAAILRFFGISIPIVEISGGIVIAGLGWTTLNKPDADTRSEEEMSTAKSAAEAADGKYIEKVFYPFTFPVTSGPATVVTMLALSAHATHTKVTDSLLAHAGISLAVLVVTGCVYGCYAYAPQLAKKIAPNTIHGVIRIISFIMFSIGIQIAWNGLSTLIRTSR
jgi:multiple antibiotic resistance protein